MSGSAAQLNRLAYFVAVVDARSFTAAAARLGVSKAVVSQQVARLEASLGITLIARTTRRTQPTVAGLAFHARCVEILRQAEEAVAEIGETTREPSGTLRLTATFAYGTAVLAPLVASFRQRYPAVSLEIVLSDTRLDLIGQRLDLAIRMGAGGRPRKRGAQPRHLRPPDRRRAVDGAGGGRRARGGGGAALGGEHGAGGAAALAAPA